MARARAFVNGLGYKKHQICDAFVMKTELESRRGDVRGCTMHAHRRIRSASAIACTMHTAQPIQ